MNELPLATDGLDRAAARRRDPEWLAQAWKRCRVLLLADGQALITEEGCQEGRVELVLLGPEGVPDDTERYFLGVDEGETPYFAVLAALPRLEGARPGTLRSVGHLLSVRDASMFATGLALGSWHQRNRYSPVSGRLTVAAEAGWTRTTGSDREVIWPRTDPAAIVLIHDGVSGPEGRCLLGSNAAWQSADGLPRYSCIAGFVEPGESAEAAAAREIEEELGISVREIRYVASQPWPFPGSLMLGFMALADGTASPNPDAEEISDARWFTRAEVSSALAGGTVGFALPMSVSIARYLMEQWLDPTATTVTAVTTAQVSA